MVLSLKDAALQAIACSWEGGKFLRPSGDARTDDLMDMARAVLDRVPGAEEAAL